MVLAKEQRAQEEKEMEEKQATERAAKLAFEEKGEQDEDIVGPAGEPATTATTTTTSATASPTASTATASAPAVQTALATMSTSTANPYPVSAGVPIKTTTKTTTSSSSSPRMQPAVSPPQQPKLVGLANLGDQMIKGVMGIFTPKPRSSSAPKVPNDWTEEQQNLAGMGFEDRVVNAELLAKYSGRVERVVDHLLQK